MKNEKKEENEEENQGLPRTREKENIINECIMRSCNRVELFSLAESIAREHVASASG
jgi:hypothetical protein